MGCGCQEEYGAGMENRTPATQLGRLATHLVRTRLVLGGGFEPPRLPHIRRMPFPDLATRE